MMTKDEQAAYAKGQLEGVVRSVSDTAERAHVRIDSHGLRLTALERVMYAGMGILFLLQVLPQLSTLVLP
jgi:hypothetical protein